MDWQTARRRTLSGEGILLVEILPKSYGYTWWINADSLNRCLPCPLPSMADGYCRETIEHLMSDAVRTWCDESLPSLTDHVCLVEVSPRRWRQGDLEFPRLSVRVFWGEATPFAS